MSQLWDVFMTSAEKDPAKTFIFFYGEEWSYESTVRKATEWAEILKSINVNKGDVVALMLSNSPQFIIWMLACWKLGAALTPINPIFKNNEIVYQLKNSEAKVIILNEENFLELMKDTRETPQGLQAIKMAKGYDFGIETIKDSKTFEERKNAVAEGAALIIYTSGTTGYPKGVMLSHQNVIADAKQITAALEIDGNDRAMLILPLFHVNGIIITVITPMLNGSSIVLRTRFALEEFLLVVQEFRPTFFSAVPTIYTRLAELQDIKDYNISSLKFGICGAAPMPLEIIQKFEHEWGVIIVEGYGLSEGSCVSTFNPLKGLRKVGSVGITLTGQQVRIVDDAGSPIEIGAIGEITIKGDNVMQGYLGNSSASAEAIKDGWLATGDLGYFDEDGYLYIVDRKKEMVIRGGENIYPKEIENILYTNPNIFEVAVIGVPDAVYGEQVMACIVLRSEKGATEQEIIDFCQQNMARYKVPKYVRFLTEIPKNSVGKITKKELKKSMVV